MDQINQVQITSTYKQKIVDHVEGQVKMGRKVSDVLSVLRVSSSSYYKWRNDLKNKETKKSSIRQGKFELTPAEIKLILETKKEYPHLRHRQLQGVIQQGRR